jgi:CHAT domain-containing protein/predicted negative regulator of RcsB-dependent stress response
MKVPRSLSMLLAIPLCCAAASVRPWRAQVVQATGANAVESSRQSKETGEAARRAEELLALSVQQNFENHALALETARQALALWQAADDHAGIARAYAHIARCYAAQSDLAEATQNYETALRIWRDLNNPVEQAENLISLGFVEALKGEWSDAISCFARAQGLIVEKDEPLQAGRIASGIAYVFNKSGSPELGLVQYRRALEYFQQTQDERDDALTILEIGSTHYQLENYREALTHFHQALNSARAELDAAHCHHYLGRVYAAMGEHAAALEHLQIALPVYTAAGNVREAAEVRALIGQVHERQGRTESARRFYRQALETFTPFSDRINQAAVYYALGRLELKEKSYDAAEAYLRQSIEVTENLRRVPASSSLTAAFSATVHDRYEKYIECLMRRPAGPGARETSAAAARAFETSEQARARSLLDLLRATQTNLIPGLDPQLAGREKALRQALRVKEDSKIALLGKTDKREKLASLEAQLARLEEEYKQIDEVIRARYPAYGQITRPAAWDLERIQREVIADDQTVLLEYSLGEDRSYVWVVTRDSFRSYELPARHLIANAAEKVYKLIANPPGADAAGDFTSDALKLSEMVLSPVAGDLDKSRVIVVADGVLNYIPFQILLPASADEQPLIARHEIVNAPSASILGELRQEAARRRPPAKMLAAFGNPVFESNYAQSEKRPGGDHLAAVRSPESARWRHALRDIELNRDTFDPAVIKPLFYAKRELSNLLDLAGSGETIVAAEFAATRERLLSTDLTQYSILHIATHGFLDPVRPENSGLILSTVDRDGRTRNGFVGLADIYALRAPVDLVVLSACQTALGKDVRGEGLLGLTRGFMYAGASGVVASLWKVDDEATAELMKQFYANLLHEEMTPAAALRAAQNRIRQQPEWRSPYYWAAFTLQGEYLQSIKPRFSAANASYRSVMGGGVFVAALAAIFVWWYRRRKPRAARSRG